MRLFSCIITHEQSATPTISLIMAQSERRACELALRELADGAAHVLSIEIRENGKPPGVAVEDDAEGRGGSAPPP